MGEELGDVVVVQLQTDADVPVPMPNRRVAFVSSGVGSPKFDPDTALTNSQGQAFTRWTLGTASGDYTAEAKVVAEGDTVVVQALIRAKALAGPPDTIRAVGPTTQPGRRGQTLADSLSIMLVDRFGNAVGGHQVAWNVEGDKDGELSQSTATTGADGVSSVTWTLGSRNFLQQAAARVDVVTGSPIGFAAVVLP
ncbi:MAG: hypothetical protein H0W70_12305 [Actinobacteria bacterium]|nr:hypothetical protein [Actinomycetota bacterium]